MSSSAWLGRFFAHNLFSCYLYALTNDFKCLNKEICLLRKFYSVISCKYIDNRDHSMALPKNVSSHLTRARAPDADTLQTRTPARTCQPRRVAVAGEKDKIIFECISDITKFYCSAATLLYMNQSGLVRATCFTCAWSSTLATKFQLRPIQVQHYAHGHSHKRLS